MPDDTWEIKLTHARGNVPDDVVAFERLSEVRAKDEARFSMNTSARHLGFPVAKGGIVKTERIPDPRGGEAIQITVTDPEAVYFILNDNFTIKAEAPNSLATLEGELYGY